MLFGREGKGHDFAFQNRCGFLVGIDRNDIGNRIPRHEFGPFDLGKFPGVITGFAKELVLLVIGILVEDAYAVVGGPAEMQVFIDINLRSVLCGALEGGVKPDIVLLRNLENFFLNGAGCDQCGGHSDE